VGPTLERVILDEALGERDVAVSAGVADGVDGAGAVLTTAMATPSTTTRRACDGVTSSAAQTLTVIG
jgi:hypothetical protein